MQFKNEKLKTIKSSIYGVQSDSIKSEIEFPVIIKAAEGSGSNGVKLVRNEREYEEATQLTSRVIFANSYKGIFKDLILGVIRKKGKRDYTSFRNKFIVQNFVSGLSGDYKVLFFAGKYFILGRKNRKNDFRASGSGLLYCVSESQAMGVLSFAKLLVDELEEPILGVDIAFDGKSYHLIEFQAGIFLGPYTLQCSDHWFEFSNENKTWDKIIGTSELEKEYCRSFHLKIESLKLGD